MDTRAFAALSRALAETTTRRRWAGFLATMPLLGSLLALFDADHSLAKDRRRRRKQRHGKRRHPRTRRKGCKPKSRAVVCAGRCGPIKNKQTCGKTINCDTCGALTCCGGSDCANLQTDADHCGACGNACGAGQTCRDGVCGAVCEDFFCAATSHICSGGRCQQCNVTCQSADHMCDMAVLQSAIVIDTNVYVCPGLYSGNLDIPAETRISITGAGLGDDPRSSTILDAQGRGRVVAVGDDANVSLRALRIRNGTSCDGAGVAVQAGARLTIARCAIVENGNADCQGGGLYTAGQTELYDSLISDNRARDGGGIAMAGPSTTLYRSEIRGNTARASGGGVYVSEGDLVLLDGSKITENEAGNPASGGGIAALAGTTVSISADSKATANTPDNCQIAGTLTGACG